MHYNYSQERLDKDLKTNDLKTERKLREVQYSRRYYGVITSVVTLSCTAIY